MSGYTIIVGGCEIVATSSSNGVAAYNLTVNVVRMTKTNTSRGVTEVSTTIVTSMPSDIRWLKGKETIIFNKETHTLDGILHCQVPAGVTIRVTDKIIYDSITYEITNVYDVNNLGVLLEIAIKRLL